MDIHDLYPGHRSIGQRERAAAGMFRAGVEGYEVPGVGLSLEEKSSPLPIAKALHLSELALSDLQVIVHYRRGLSYTFSLFVCRVVFRICFQLIDPGLQYRVEKSFVIQQFHPRLKIDSGGGAFQHLLEILGYDDSVPLSGIVRSCQSGISSC